MITSRRSLMQVAGAAALVTPYAGFIAKAAAQSAPLFKFGVIADPQYAPVVPNLQLNRYYSNTLWKLSAAIAELNKEELAFVVTLGDIIDRDYSSFGHVLPLYDKLRADKFFLLGNHDYSVAADYLASVLRTAGMTKAYYDFAGGGYRFVVLDGNDVSLFSDVPGSAKHKLATERLAAMKAAGAINAQVWNGSLSEEQYAWLGQTLAKAQTANERVIVMGHYPIYPANEDNLWDCERLTDVLAKAPNVVGYFCGHHHPGNYGEFGGKYFVNFHGMVDTPDTSAYAIVEVYADRINIRGYGREENRTLKLSA